jgi:hypothetical protein
MLYHNSVPEFRAIRPMVIVAAMIALTLSAVWARTAAAWPRDPNPAVSLACVDTVGHLAACRPEDPGVDPYDNSGVHHQWECRASDNYGRCPTDPLCQDAVGQPTACIGKIIFATARCADGSATASNDPDKACAARGGVSVSLSANGTSSTSKPGR